MFKAFGQFLKGMAVPFNLVHLPSQLRKLYNQRTAPKRPTVKPHSPGAAPVMGCQSLPRD
jgi:hypothetical protein